MCLSLCLFLSLITTMVDVTSGHVCSIRTWKQHRQIFWFKKPRSEVFIIAYLRISHFTSGARVSDVLRWPTTIGLNPLESSSNTNFLTDSTKAFDTGQATNNLTFAGLFISTFYPLMSRSMFCFLVAITFAILTSKAISDLFLLFQTRNLSHDTNQILSVIYFV